MTMRRAALVACTSATAVVAAGTFAWAAIPASDGTITACYGKAGDNLRVVDSAAGCKSSETALTWSQQGIAGPVGPQGATGATGATGA
ncbi:MAG: hypothetical protein ACRD2W_16025, partial [Acidimicrobiales bacterium]